MQERDQLKISVALSLAEDAARDGDVVRVRRQLRDLRLLMTDAGLVHPSWTETVSYTPHENWALRCDDCGATGCKLWREYQTCSPDVLCANCVEKRTGRALDPERLSSIEWWVAAIPDEEGTGYWGFTSVPEAGVRWWNDLPTRLNT